MKYYSAVKRMKSYVCRTMGRLKGIMLSETSQRKTNTVRYHLYVESKNYKKLVHITEKNQTHRYREQTSGY